MPSSSPVPPIRILHLEDNAGDAELIRQQLLKSGLHFTIERVETRQDFEQALAGPRPDVVLSDCVLPSFDGLSAVKLARRLAPDVPVIPVTGVLADKVIANLVEAGANDYVLKDRLARLGSAVRHAVDHARLQRWRAQLEASVGSHGARVQDLVEHIADVVAVLGADGTIVRISPGVEAMAGYTPAEVIGRRFADFVHPEEESALEQRVVQIRELPGIPLRTTAQVRHKNGSWLTVETASANLSDLSDIGGIVVALRDVTREAQAARALRESEARFQQLAANLQEVLFVSDAATGALLYVSPAYETLWGRSCESLHRDPRDWVQGVHPEDRARLEAVTAKPGELDETYRIVRPDGGVRWLHSRATLARNDTGEASRIVGVTMDITQHKEQQQRIERLNRGQAMLSGVNNLIVRARTRAELFQEACRIAVEQGGFRLAWIGMALDGDEVVPVAHAGQDYGTLSSLRLKLDAQLPNGDGPAATALREGRAAIFNDIAAVESSSPWRTLLLQWGLRAAAAFPLKVGGKVVGAMMFYAAEAAFFDDEEVKLLAGLACDISYALEFITKDETLDFLAIYDPLTRLPNRTLFARRLGERLQVARERGGRVATLLLDVAGFRHVNEALQQAGGDELLKRLADRIKHFAGGPSFVGRLGADQFVFMLEDVPATDTELLALLRQPQAWEGLEVPFRIGDREIQPAYRLGCAVFPDHGADADALLRNAESALKHGKATGDQVSLYADELGARAATRVTLEGELRRALRREEFVLHYQPKLNLRSRQVCGAEALVRWDRPHHGLVFPAEFVWALEQSDLIVDVGRWVMAQAVNDYCDWSREGLTVPRLSVNVAQRQLLKPDFVQGVRDALDERKCGPHALELEITESVMMGDVEQSIAKLRAIADCGVRIALDDFGTGYSSLAYLARLPAHAIKIDRSFVHRMTHDADAMAIVSTVISLAHSMGFKVVAEGVETAEEIKLLHLLKCDEIQGFLLSEAVSAAEFARLLRDPSRLGGGLRTPDPGARALRIARGC